MNRKRIFLSIGIAAIFAALFYFYSGHSTPKGQPALVTFGPGNLAPLKNEFNQASSAVRVVVMLSPT